jgi:hypothetical protein
VSSIQINFLSFRRVIISFVTSIVVKPRLRYELEARINQHTLRIWLYYLLSDKSVGPGFLSDQTAAAARHVSSNTEGKNHHKHHRVDDQRKEIDSHLKPCFLLN